MRKILSKISGLRIKRGLSRGKMAGALGVNTSTYTKMEKGIYLISLSRLNQIAAALEVKSDALLDNVDPEMDFLEEQYNLTQDRLERVNQLIIAEQSKLIDLYEKLK
ncbi:transcriptional regulator with XRE-family HTH domain [Pedobacter sp. CAN_A7]|uniref:helix-turn-helix domain-containing protein n=1 Tax=Pedobacter sp. CAN_A7 TaxID=2787722 RepID=UPI0018C9A3D8